MIIITLIGEIIMSRINTQIDNRIEVLRENNIRLQAQIDSGSFQSGYVENCKNYIEANNELISTLKAMKVVDNFQPD